MEFALTPFIEKRAVYRPVVCELTKGLMEMGSLLSSGYFLLITVERYLLIVQTFRMKTFQHRYKHVPVALNLLLASITVLPYLHGVQIELESGRCVTFIGGNRAMGRWYVWFTFIVYSLLPIVVATSLSVKLAKHFSLEKTSVLMVKRDAMNKRIMVNIITILSLFVLCTLPSRVVSIAMDMVDSGTHDIILGFQFLSYLLYSLQGTLNPILYSMMAKQWRRSFATEMRTVFVQDTVITSFRFSNEE